MIKILFTDIDGVVVPKVADPIHPDVAAAVRKASKFIHISFCTGRNKHDTWPLIQACGLENEYHILESGTRVLAPGGTWEYVKPIDKGLISELLSTTESIRDAYGICQEDVWLNDMNDVNPKSPITIVSINTITKKQTDQVVQSLQKFTSIIHIGVGTHYENPHGACIHLTDIQANKSYGVRYLQKRLNLSRDESAAIGDMPMDEIFFRECGYILAPENAHEETKKMAHKVVPSVDDHGYIDALKHLIGEV